MASLAKKHSDCRNPAGAGVHARCSVLFVYAAKREYRKALARYSTGRSQGLQPQAGHNDDLVLRFTEDGTEET